MRNIAVLAFVFIPLVGLTAQTTSERATQTPASREDIQNATKEMKKTIRDTERKAAERIAAEREKTTRETKAAVENSEKRLKAELAEKAAQEELDRKRQRNEMMLTVYGFIALVVIIIIFGVMLAIRKNRHETQTLTTSLNNVRPEVLFNPNLLTLRDFSERNNGITKVPFVLPLREGVQFNCIAELRTGLAPLVYFDKEEFPVAWDKRRQKASDLMAQKTK
jgi:predicted nucleic acid-binding Zn ribbon protein